MSHFTDRGEDRLYLSGEWYRRFMKKCDNCEIDRLADQGLISELMRLAADEIRFAGNDAVHGNFIHEPITIGDAEDIVSLMDTILERIYQEPAGVERVRANRERRRRHAQRSRRKPPTGRRKTSLTCRTSQKILVDFQYWGTDNTPRSFIRPPFAAPGEAVTRGV